MKSSKGQSLIAIVVLTSTAFMYALVIMMLTLAIGNPFETQTDTQIANKLGEVRKQSLITSTLQDRMWRADSISEGKYDSRTAYKIISYYYSTPSGEKVHVDGESYSKSTVRNDIKNYLQQKMSRTWTGVQDVKYRLTLVDYSSPRSDKISIGDYQPEGTGYKTSFPLALVDGDQLTLTLWTLNSEGVYSKR
ncbi:MAG: hypothetical protein ABEJ95_03965 [Candidatus Nanohalobium sp.]